MEVNTKMAKRVFVTSKSTPDQPGWMDWIEVWEDGKKLWEGPGSSSPSPLAYKEYEAAQDAGRNPKREDYTSDKRGGMIDYGTYNFLVEDHPLYKRSLKLNGGGEVDSRWPNPRHNNRPVLDEVFVHNGYYAGDRDMERGSSGCITIRPDHWRNFQNVFGEKETGEVIVVRPPLLQGIGGVKPIEAEQQQKIQSSAQDIGVSYGDAAGTAMLTDGGKTTELQDPMRTTKEVLTSVDAPEQSQKYSIDDVVDYITNKIWPWR